MIILEDVSFRYAGATLPALERVSLTVDNHAWVAVTGPVASGKTTLCKIIKGLLQPSAGRVIFTESHAGSSDIAYLGGDPYDTLVGTSVEEDVAFGMENLGLPYSEMKTRLKQALAWTDLTGMEKRLVNTLSGGEQQKLALAGALAAGARGLILDEAMSMLDKSVRKSIRTLVNSLRVDPGVAIVEVTHDLEDISTADSVVFISDGKIGFEGNYTEFLGDPSGEFLARSGWGLEGFRRELIRLGIALADCRDNSQLSDCLLKVMKK